MAKATATTPDPQPAGEAEQTRPASSSKKKTAKKERAKAKKSTTAGATRSRKARPYPSASFEESLALGNAIITLAGQRVRRLTLLEQMKRSPTSSATQMMITNSGKYKITKGSYVAEWLELTPEGRTACDDGAPPRARLTARVGLAITGIPPFKRLYDEYVGKRVAAREVMKDVLKESDSTIEDLNECVDLFIVNVKFLGLLRTIGGAETLVSVEQAADELPATPAKDTVVQRVALENASAAIQGFVASTSKVTDWSKLCFYITPIGDEGSEARQHADLFTGTLVEPAIAELGLTVIRADKIGEPGMITSQVMAHIKKCALAIADLSLLNPNVFYEMALRHACKMPIVHLIRKADRLPFDINQFRSIVIDTTSIYTLTPKVETYRSEIATQARKAIEDAEHTGNPITVFYPDFWKP